MAYDSVAAHPRQSSIGFIRLPFAAAGGSRKRAGARKKERARRDRPLERDLLIIRVRMAIAVALMWTSPNGLCQRSDNPFG